MTKTFDLNDVVMNDLRIAISYRMDALDFEPDETTLRLLECLLRVPGSWKEKYQLDAWLKQYDRVAAFQDILNGPVAPAVENGGA